MKQRLYGLLFSVALSLIVLFIFFGKVIKDPGNIFFSTSGDGLKAYYTALYHVKYDKENFRSDGMNYPFGESLSFTDAQIPVINTIRFISTQFADISDHTVAIINLLMLFSIVAGAVFLCLILMETEVSWWYAALVSVAIAFLSPQVDRLGGHFSLAWVCWIPLMSWLIIRFDRSRLLIYSVMMGIVTWLAGLMHFYYLGFFGFLVGGYWLFRFIYYRKASTYWYRDLLHFSIQYLLPVLLLHFMVISNDGVSDRPSYPFGYQSSIAHPVGVFFPSGRPWAFVPQILTVFNHIGWESRAYIGAVALAGSFTGIYFIFRKMARKETPFRVSFSRQINVLFWISFFALLFSFGIPYFFGWEEWVGQPAILRQMRVLARFSWLFFYFINLVVFSTLYSKAFGAGGDLKRKILAIAAVIVILTESAFHSADNAGQLHNRIPEWEDQSNILPVNAWVAGINSADYQAVIPLPFFHIGSENIWVEGSDESKRNTLLISLKTGLPTMGVMLSRTSLSQTFMSDALFREPLQRVEIVDFLPDDRPFLICLTNGHLLSESEKWFISGAERLTGNERFTLYSLPVSHVRSLHETWRRQIYDRFESEKQFSVDGYYISDTLAFHRQFSFDHNYSMAVLRGSGAFMFTSGEWYSMLSDTLAEVPKGKKLLVGFWVYPCQRDGTLRSNLEIVQKNPENGDITGSWKTEFFKHLKACQGDWALVELEIETHCDREILQLSVRNNVIPDAGFVIDELMIREKGTDIWIPENKYLIFNGRTFQRR